MNHITHLHHEKNKTSSSSSAAPATASNGNNALVNGIINNESRVRLQNQNNSTSISSYSQAKTIQQQNRNSNFHAQTTNLPLLTNYNNSLHNSNFTTLPAASTTAVPPQPANMNLIQNVLLEKSPNPMPPQITMTGKDAQDLQNIMYDVSPIKKVGSAQAAENTAALALQNSTYKRSDDFHDIRKSEFFVSTAANLLGPALLIQGNLNNNGVPPNNNSAVAPPQNQQNIATYETETQQHPINMQNTVQYNEPPHNQQTTDFFNPATDHNNLNPENSSYNVHSSHSNNLSPHHINHSNNFSPKENPHAENNNSNYKKCENPHQTHSHHSHHKQFDSCESIAKLVGNKPDRLDSLLDQTYNNNNQVEGIESGLYQQQKSKKPRVFVNLTFDYRENILNVEIIESANLSMYYSNKEFEGKEFKNFVENGFEAPPSSYIKTYLLPDRSKSSKKKTKVQPKNANPNYHQTMKYKITQTELETRTLEVSAWQKDTFSRNYCIGVSLLPLDSRNWNGSSAQRWLYRKMK